MNILVLTWSEITNVILMNILVLTWSPTFSSAIAIFPPFSKVTEAVAGKHPVGILIRHGNLHISREKAGWTKPHLQHGVQYCVAGRITLPQNLVSSWNVTPHWQSHMGQQPTVLFQGNLQTSHGQSQKGQQRNCSVVLLKQTSQSQSQGQQPVIVWVL